MVDLKIVDPLKYIRCDNGQCGKYSFEQDLEKNDYKCPSCGKRISKPVGRFKSDLSLEETNVPSNVCKSKEKLRDLFDFLISQEREITIQIEGNKTSYTSRIIKAVYGDVLSKVGKGDELVIEKLTPDTGNALLKLSPRLLIQFPLRDQTLKFDTKYLGESINYPNIGLIVRFPDSVRIEERGIYDQNTLIFSETGEEEEMNKPGIGSLEHRIDKLEKQNRLLRMVGMVAVIALVLAVLTTYVYPRTSVRDLKAQKFVVQDESGITRAFLGVDKYGTTGLFMNSRQGDPRFVLYIKPNGEEVIRMLDRLNTRRFILSISPEGNPSVWLLDKDGNALASLP